MKFLSNTLGFIAISGLLILSSCANEAPWGSNNESDGKINLNLKADGAILMSTRADDNVSPFVPDKAEFSISLKSNDGTYSGNWKTLSAFNSEDGFPMGSYIISASFGDKDSEGFSHPYFYGEAPVNVVKGEESKVDLTATLANAMLSIRYTDEFAKFFKGYSATSTSEGHNPVAFVQTENRPAYISTGNVDIKLTLTNTANQTVTLSPTSFKAEPQKHYILTFGVDGNTNISDATLSITWSEDVETVDEEIYLNDELFTSPAPVITLEGFNETDLPEEFFEGIEYEKINPEFHVMTLGGLKEATLILKTEDESNVNSFPLVGADENTKAILAGYGVDCSGLYEVDSKFGVVNLKEYLKGLEEGSYIASINVKDKYSRTLEQPVELKVKVNGLEYKFLSYEQPDFLDKEIVVYIETNCSDLKDQLIFKAWDDNGNFVNVEKSEYLNDIKPENIEAANPYVFSYRLTLANVLDNWEWKASVMSGKKAAHETQILINMPEFILEKDPFAKKVKFRLGENSDEKVLNQILQYGKIFDGEKIVVEDVSKLYSNNMFVLDGLNPNQQYEYTLNLGRTLFNGDKGYKGNLSFETELNREVPNGDFEQLTIKYNNKTINQSGTWNTSALDFTSNYQNTATFTIHEASGWATTNDRTMSGTPENTWFTIPSVFNSGLKYETYCSGVSGGGGRGSKTPNSYSGFIGRPESGSETAMVIRNVGWEPKGTVPGRCSQTPKWGQSDYYNHTKPTVSQKAIGKMFLGEYNYTGESNIPEKEGVKFESRPSSLSGYYRYELDTSNQEDVGVVVVQIKNGDKIIASGTSYLEPCLSFQRFNIDLTYSDFGIKATDICIMIKSSNLPDENDIALTTYHTTFECFIHGATLVVDDFTFEY